MRLNAHIAAWVALVQVGMILGAEVRPATVRQPFALGIEYMVPGLAEAYAPLGLKWAKAMGQGFSWGDVEPRPPAGRIHTYDWTYTDRLIVEYQRAGFEHLHIYLKCRCPWASSKPLPAVGTPSYPPKPEHMGDYAEYVRQIVERYDKDGKDDAPGLLYPVEYWEIEAEWGTFWPGTVEEYLELLRVAQRAVKSANPRAKVILVGFFLAGVFEGNPDPDRWQQVVLERHPPHRVKAIEKGIADVRALLAHPELFDVVEFHSLSDWSEIPGMSRFLRRIMRDNGYEKPIWVGDVNFTASPLMFWGTPVPPYTAEQKPRIEQTLRALADAKNPQHAAVEAWFRAEQSRGLVKKVVLTMAEGLAGINIGNMEDWGIFALAPTVAGTSAFQGLMEVKGVPRRAVEPRPAWHALALVAQKIGAFTEAAPVDAGKGVYCFRFRVGQRQVHVVWYDDGRRYLPGDAEPAVTVRLRMASGTYAVTPTPTARGAPPAQKLVTAPEGILSLTVDSTPLFVEAAM